MNLWRKLLRRESAKSMFLKFSPRSSSWSVVSWNFDIKESGNRTWLIEVTQDSPQSIEYQKAKVHRIIFSSAQKVRGFPAAAGDEALMNLALHSTLKHALESHQSFMLAPVSGVTSLDYQNETRALQWLQGTFGTLARALDKVEVNGELILTAAFFSGIEPATGDRVLRLLVFNLDIFLYMKPDQSLQVVVFDDKNMGHGGAKAPSYQQIIKVTKPQFYDEMVRIVHLVGRVGEVK